jgi:ribonuclease HI
LTGRAKCEPSNPGGEMGMGYYITDGINEIADNQYRKASPNNTNNIAEYMALIMVLKLMRKKENCCINIYGDSMLVIKQMNAEWDARKGGYMPYMRCAKEIYEEIRLKNKVTFSWIPREQNEKADYQSMKAIGFKRRKR